MRPVLRLKQLDVWHADERLRDAWSEQRNQGFDPAAYEPFEGEICGTAIAAVARRQGYRQYDKECGADGLLCEK